MVCPCASPMLNYRAGSSTEWGQSSEPNEFLVEYYRKKKNRAARFGMSQWRMHIDILVLSRFMPISDKSTIFIFARLSTIG